MSGLVDQPGGGSILLGIVILFVVLGVLAGVGYVQLRKARAGRSKFPLLPGLSKAQEYDRQNEDAVGAAVAVALAKPRAFAQSLAEAAAQMMQRNSVQAAPKGPGADNQTVVLLVLKSQMDSGDRFGSAESLAKLGRIFQRQGDTEQSRAFFLKSLATFRDLASENRLGRAEGNPSVGQENGHAASEAALRCHRGLGLVLVLIGWLESESDWRYAEQFFALALEVFEAMAEEAGAAAALDGLGVIQHLKGDLEGAEAYHRDALAVAEALGDQPAAALDHALIGNVFLSRDQPRQASESLRAAIALLDAQGMRDRTAEMHAALGDSLSRLGDAAGAHHEWSDARALFQDHGNDDMVAEMDLLIRELGSVDRADPAAAEVG